MKRFVMLAALAAVSTPAMAADSSNPVVVFEAERPEVCEVRNFDPTINFGNLGNLGASGAPETDTLELFCNVRYSATIESDNGRLQLDTTVPEAQPGAQGDNEANGYSGFASALDYQVQTVLGNADTSMISNDTPVALGGTQDPINVTTTIAYTTIPGSLPLLGGEYEDTLTLTITPISF